MIDLKLHVNGREELLRIEPAETLLDVLRHRLHLTGTKESCREGECGACTVLIDGQPVDSCLYAAKAAEGVHVETIESLAGTDALTAVQRALLEAAAVQCGYCTPGFVMTITALLRDHPDADEERIRTALSGNVCRCTGYAQIVEAVKRVRGAATETAS